MKIVWTAIGSVLAVAAIVTGTYSVVNLIAHEEVTERATFDADGITAVDVHGENGTVQVVGGDVDEISLEARLDHGLRRTVHRAHVDGGTLVVDADCPTGMPVWCRVDYRLEVPRDLVIDIDNENGRVILRDLDGAVTVESSNGDVEVARLGGIAHLTTSNGSIEGRGLTTTEATAATSNGGVDLSFTDAPRGVDAHTHNGSIDIVLPEAAPAYRVEAHTSFNGSTDIAVRTDPSAERTIVARTSNGSVTVRYPTG